MNLQIYKDYFGVQTGGGGEGNIKFSVLFKGEQMFFPIYVSNSRSPPPPGDNKLYFSNKSVACPFFTLDELKTDNKCGSFSSSKQIIRL